MLKKNKKEKGKTKRSFRVITLKKFYKIGLGALALLVISGAGYSMTKAKNIPSLETALQGFREKTVYLTFDDGPSSRTYEILDILDKHDIKACFFVIGAGDEKGKEIIREAHQRGHTVAPHSFSHNYREIYKSVGAFEKDFDKICKYIEEATGEVPKLLRFPGGSKNQIAVRNGTMDKIIKLTEEKGFKHIDWNVVSGDDTATVFAPEVLLENVKNGSKGVKNPVILFHDTYHNKTTPEAVEMVINYFEEMGYSFKRLEEDSPIIK